MIRFYQNRELSRYFNIKLSRWKRWSREFLPPDPLGGMQSGYARQYSLEQAFTVYLGGHLVADLRFSIPEAKGILADLEVWLKEKQTFFWQADDHLRELPASLEMSYCRLYIYRKIAPDSLDVRFFYIERTTLADDVCRGYETGARKEVYVEREIDPSRPGATEILTENSDRLAADEGRIGSKLLYITELYTRFMINIGKEGGAGDSA